MGGAQFETRFAEQTSLPDLTMAALSDTESWFQRLTLRVQKIDSLLCVGLDPHVKVRVVGPTGAQPSRARPCIQTSSSLRRCTL